MSKKKWRIEIVLDFRNNKIKKKSTLDSIMERMSTGYSMIDALVAAAMPVNPEPVEAMASEPRPQADVGTAMARIDIITGNCPRCGLPLRFAVNRAHPVIDFNCHNCGRHMTERELHGYPH